MIELSGKADVIRFCRLDTMYNQDLRRITFAVVDTDVRNTVVKAMQETQAERKYGRAPRTWMEREMQEWVQHLVGERK